jgi:hypothetical protein
VFDGGVAEWFVAGNRVLIEDDRSNGTFVRMTWHPESRVIVVSHWRDDVCLAATRVPVEAASDVVGLFVKAMSDSMQTPGSTPQLDTPSNSWVERVRRSLHERLARRSA